MSIKICQFLWWFTRTQFDAYTFVFFCSSMGCQMDPQVEPFWKYRHQWFRVKHQTQSKPNHNSAIRLFTLWPTRWQKARSTVRTHPLHTSDKWQAPSWYFMMCIITGIIKIHEIINGHTRICFNNIYSSIFNRSKNWWSHFLMGTLW